MVGGGHMSPSFHLGSMLEALLFSEKLSSQWPPGSSQLSPGLPLIEFSLLLLSLHCPLF